MSKGACILAHFADQEKLIPAAAKLSADRAISHWDAVDGHVHLVAWTSEPQAARDSIGTLEGVDRVTAYETAQPSSPIAPDPALCHAYVFIEAENAKRDQLMKALAGISGVTSVTAARGGCDLIALVSGETFSRVDVVIRDRIRSLDGVLRLKHNRIIDLKQL
ncbi:hypothetical protein C3F09_04610 [candidate division GN15 bacterium]|uniref:Transcription regulator AsnC/Lrp ligand binding domain-containing protein n=1 Tax=candidate division GN15 bacterium TaxID=2072418 RepID=A0A855X7R6_9BACT|nr:MAG: hypothetical protein C3F09_04610 [candidate division GN15 bacterium]